MTAIAGQTHDLVLGGDGFMLAQGGKGMTSYKKALDGPLRIGLTPADVTNYEVLHGMLDAPVQTFKRAVWSKWTGLGQGMVAGADGWEQAQKAGRVNDLVALRPVQNGGALALAPQGVSAQVEAAASTNTRYQYVTFGALSLVAIGPRIYKSASPGTNNSGFVFLGAAVANVVGMAVWNGTVYVSTSTNLYTLNITTGALTASTTPANRAVDFIISFQGMMFVSAGATLLWWIPATAAWSAGLVLESNINALEEFDGSLYIGCDSGLFKIEGQLKAKSPSTAPAVLDWFDYKFILLWRVIPSPAVNGNVEEFNFSKMVAWKGALWGFVGGRLFRIRPGSSAATLQIEEQPVYGSSRGIAVCGRWLVVATIITTATTVRTFWVNEAGADNGLGWWKLDQGGTYIYPFSNAGYSQGVINAFNNATTASTNFWRWLVDQGNPVGFRPDNFGVARTAVTGQLTLPLVTPEDLAQLSGATGGKVLAVNFRRVGLEWSVIDGGAWWPAGAGGFGASPVIGIDVSLDAGVTWLTLVDPAGGPSLSALSFNHHRLELPANLNFYTSGRMYPSAAPNGVGPGGFQPPPDVGWTIRVTFGGTEAPLLRRVWIDYDVAEVAPQTGRSWQFEVNLSEPQIGLDGAVEVSPNDASSKAGRLWDLAESGESTTFSDMDGQTYRVKVTGFEQKRLTQGAMPGLSPEWSGLVKLAEVWPGN